MGDAESETACGSTKSPAQKAPLRPYVSKKMCFVFFVWFSSHVTYEAKTKGRLFRSKHTNYQPSNASTQWSLDWRSNPKKRNKHHFRRSWDGIPHGFMEFIFPWLRSNAFRCPVAQKWFRAPFFPGRRKSEPTNPSRCFRDRNCWFSFRKNVPTLPKFNSSPLKSYLIPIGSRIVWNNHHVSRANC